MSAVRTVMIANKNRQEAECLKKYLQTDGYRVMCAAEGSSAYKMTMEDNVDIALVDLHISNMDGLSLTRKIRDARNIPIIIYTEPVSDDDKIKSLNLGADDVVEKPVNPLEVVARVNAQLRRYYILNPSGFDKRSDNILRLDGLCLNMESLSLEKNGHNVPITPNEYKILQLLMSNPGRVFSKADLCRAVNGEVYDNYENAIMVHIFHLREKIENNPKKPRYLKNIRGVGYTMSL